VNLFISPGDSRSRDRRWRSCPTRSCFEIDLEKQIFELDFHFAGQLLSAALGSRGPSGAFAKPSSKVLSDSSGVTNTYVRDMALIR